MYFNLWAFSVCFLSTVRQTQSLPLSSLLSATSKHQAVSEVMNFHGELELLPEARYHKLIIHFHFQITRNQCCWTYLRVPSFCSSTQLGLYKSCSSLVSVQSNHDLELVTVGWAKADSRGDISAGSERLCFLWFTLQWNWNAFSTGWNLFQSMLWSVPIETKNQEEHSVLPRISL